MKKSKKSIIIGITVLLLLITLILLGLTYAYYRTRIIGNPNNESISVTSMELEVTYSDGSSMVNMEGNVEPGYEYTKEFSVENTEAATASYTIVLDNVANTFTRTGDWTYTLTETGSTEELASGIINRLEIQTVLANISIDSGEITNYTLEVKYNEKDEDQSVDMSKSMVFRVNIVDASAWDKATEGSLLYALKENNAVVEPLAVPGKLPSGGTYIESDGTSSTDSISANYQSSRYYAYSETYTFDERSGTYSLVNPKVATYAEVSTNLKDKYVGSYVPTSSNQIETTSLSSIYLITSAPAASTSSSVTIGYTPKKNKIEVIEEEAVLSSTADDYGTSYYFRGTVENNYVNYSGMCWRIVRVDGNGNIKLALADGNGECNATTYSVDNQKSAFVYGRTDIGYNMYLYRSEYFQTDLVYEDSSIPIILNTWASSKIINSDGTIKKEQNLDTSKLAIAEWCNDLSSDGDDYFEDFGAAIRLGKPETANPTLKCNSIGIEESTNIGSEGSINAKKYSSYIGMLTADEVAFAGGVAAYYSVTNYNYNYYLKTNATGYFYWTLSPEAYITRDRYAYVYTVQPSGSLVGKLVGEHDWDEWDEHVYFGSVRPVILLKSDVTVTTDTNSEYAPGTYQNPYVVI